jgi:hypothetical protein
VIALWTCEPAYLATFQDFLEDQEPNPYQDEDEMPELGSELLVAAWLVREQSDETTFNEWERKAVREHAALVTL